MQAVDVKTAFLYGKLDEEIYMQQPEGFKLRGQETKVLRLLRALLVTTYMIKIRQLPAARRV